MTYESGKRHTRVGNADSRPDAAQKNNRLDLSVVSSRGNRHFFSRRTRYAGCSLQSSPKFTTSTPFKEACPFIPAPLVSTGSKAGSKAARISESGRALVERFDIKAYSDFLVK